MWTDNDNRCDFSGKELANMSMIDKRYHYWADIFKEHPEKLKTIKYPKAEDISHLLPYEIDKELLNSLLEIPKKKRRKKKK